MKIQKNEIINLKYSCNDTTKQIILTDGFSSDDLDCRITTSDNVLKVKIIPKVKIELIKSTMIMHYDFNPLCKIFPNGYQSWTDSREFTINEKMHNINHVPKFILNKYMFDKYGDYSFKEYSDKPGIFHGFSYGYVRNGDNFELIGSLSEKSGYTIINYNTLTSQIIIEKDCVGTVTDDEFNLYDVTFLNGNEEYVFNTYFKLMNIEKPRVKPMTGYTSWYNHYQNISEDIILDNLTGISDFNPKLDIFQIDDGYQTAVGDWLSIDKNKFKNGLKPIVQNIKSKGLIPGLWLAPFVCEKNSEIYKNHNDWLLKDSNGYNVAGGSNWSGFFALDISLKEVQNYIRNVFDIVLNDWGFELVKLDFLYAVALIPNGSKSRGQIMCEAMDFLRECVGDKLILGCGVPLAPAFGKVDFCRIGCDISLDFDGTFVMRRFHRERVSTKNAILNTMYRRQLDNRAFLNDPDVFLLRDDNIKLTKKQKYSLAAVNALLGSLLFTSDNVSMYDQEKITVATKSLELMNAKVVSIEKTGSYNYKIIYTMDKKRHVFRLKLK